MSVKAESKADAFYTQDFEGLAKEIGKEALIKSLEKMLLIRNFETRAEASYLQGKIGGFFHSYIGQEAIQTAAVEVIGKENWWVTTYRCHALALLLGVTPFEIAAELFGKEVGNAFGRGGSMHLYSDRLLGGFGIVGGQVPIATGAALSIKYLKKKNEIAVCFLGEGAVAQGAFHEAINMASLWNLPCLYVIENNRWGMGTGVERALANKRIAEEKAPSYAMEGYTVDGMNYYNCVAAFKFFKEKILKEGRPLLVEFLTERFKGHSVSDPGLYRSKESLEKCKQNDPILKLHTSLEKLGYLTEEEFKTLDKKIKESVVDAIKEAEQAKDPDPVLLEEDVLSP